MCPDGELLSAYFDGEVPDPWKTRIDYHVSGCEACRERLEGFSALRSGMAGGAAPSGMEPSLERVWERLVADTSGRTAAERRNPAVRPRPAKRPAAFWARSVSVPLPLAAAALIAIAVVPALTVASIDRMGSGRAMAAASAAPATAKPGIVQASVVDPSSPGIAIPADASFQDIDSLLRFLDSQNLPVTISVELPADRSYGYSGPPEIVKISAEDGGKDGR